MIDFAHPPPNEDRRGMLSASVASNNESKTFLFPCHQSYNRTAFNSTQNRLIGSGGLKAKPATNPIGRHTMASPDSVSSDSSRSTSSSRSSCEDEILYGPGFVSKLKSRFIKSNATTTTLGRVSNTAAQANSARLHRLRRVASLEEFVGDLTTTSASSASDEEEENENIVNGPVFESNRITNDLYSKTSDNSEEQQKERGHLPKGLFRKNGGSPVSNKNLDRGISQPSSAVKRQIEAVKESRRKFGGSLAIRPTSSYKYRAQSVEVLSSIMSSEEDMPVFESSSTGLEDEREDYSSIEATKENTSSDLEDSSCVKNAMPKKHNSPASGVFPYFTHEFPTRDTVRERRKFFESNNGAQHGSKTLSASSRVVSYTGSVSSSHRPPGPFIFGMYPVTSTKGKTGSSKVAHIEQRTPPDLPLKVSSHVTTKDRLPVPKLRSNSASTLNGVSPIRLPSDKIESMHKCTQEENKSQVMVNDSRVEVNRNIIRQRGVTRGGVRDSHDSKPICLPPKKKIGVIKPITRSGDLTSSTDVNNRVSNNDGTDTPPPLPVKLSLQNVQPPTCLTESTLKSTTPFVTSSAQNKVRKATESVVLIQTPKEDQTRLKQVKNVRNDDEKCSVFKNIEKIKNPDSTRRSADVVSSSAHDKVRNATDGGISPVSIVSCKPKVSPTPSSTSPTAESTSTSVVFNFAKSSISRDISHVENDGLDFSKTKKSSSPSLSIQNSSETRRSNNALNPRVASVSDQNDTGGVVETSSSTRVPVKNRQYYLNNNCDDSFHIENGENQQLSNDIENQRQEEELVYLSFIGAGVIVDSGSCRKISSSLQKSTSNTMIRFCNQPIDVFEYPSYETLLAHHSSSNSTSDGVDLNNSQSKPSLGKLSNYQPCNMVNMMNDTHFGQLGLSRFTPTPLATAHDSTDLVEGGGGENKTKQLNGDLSSKLPIDSNSDDFQLNLSNSNWSSSNTSDMLF